MGPSRRLGLSGKLCDLDDHELRRFERGESHHDVDDPSVNVGLRRRLAIALDLKCFAWS